MCRPRSPRDESEPRVAAPFGNLTGLQLYSLVLELQLSCRHLDDGSVGEDEVEGTPFGRYRLIELLGRGGMGEVWRAHDTVIDRTVAIKTLLPHFAQDRTFEQRFRREARAAARLDEPHVVPIYDVGEIDGRLYVAMRLIDGKDLQTMLEAGPLEPQRAVDIIGQIAKALNAAHKVSLVHRDIKPSNILVTEDDFAYLIDFGIARAAGETALTSTGATIGTWAYMAPERFSTGIAEPHSDTYALACVLFQCLTGQVPFPVVALEQIAVAHLTTPPPHPSAIRDLVPSAMDQVVATGMNKDPHQRYPTTRDLASAAEAALINRDRQQCALPTEPANAPAATTGPSHQRTQLGLAPQEATRVSSAAISGWARDSAPAERAPTQKDPHGDMAEGTQSDWSEVQRRITGLTQAAPASKPPDFVQRIVRAIFGVSYDENRPLWKTNVIIGAELLLVIALIVLASLYSMWGR